MAVKDYIRQRFLPHIWCAGCGHGIIMANMIRAIEQLNLKKNDIVVVSGIGCSSRMPGYLDFHTMHTIHGRALAFAMGVKMGRPELNVIVPMGDGDALAIGGNHLIHAARRNVDLTAIVMNNNIYGMTGGQFSPLTPRGKRPPPPFMEPIPSPLTLWPWPRGGATFVARTTTYHVKEMIDILKAAILHKGFSVVEIMSQCPTYYGRKNKLGGAVEIMKAFQEETVKAGSKKRKHSPELIQRGIFVQEDQPEYVESYQDLTATLQKWNRKVRHPRRRTSWINALCSAVPADRGLLRRPLSLLKRRPFMKTSMRYRRKATARRHAAAPPERMSSFQKHRSTTPRSSIPIF
jgi:2-oxoglutarate ferredoxin oxidoreductase subunit beta